MCALIGIIPTSIDAKTIQICQKLRHKIKRLFPDKQDNGRRGRQNLLQYREKSSTGKVPCRCMPTADTEGVTDAGANLYRTAAKVAQRPWHSIPDGRIQSASHQMPTDRSNGLTTGRTCHNPPQKSSRVFGKKLQLPTSYMHTRALATRRVYIDSQIAVYGSLRITTPVTAR